MAHWAGPHWLLNDEDAKNYANAVNNVARHYDVAVAQKTIDICNLIGMACFIEGTRLLVSRHPQKAQAQRPSAQVVPIVRFDHPPPPFAGAGFGPFPPSAAAPSSHPDGGPDGPPTVPGEGQFH
jgi:hypothetical protein